MSSLFTLGERERVFYFKVGGGGGTDAVNEVAKIKGSRIRKEKRVEDVEVLTGWALARCVCIGSGNSPYSEPLLLKPLNRT